MNPPLHDDLTPAVRIGGARARLARGLRRLAMLAPLALAACGGGSDGGGPPPLTCSVADQETWAQAYFNDQYYFYANIDSAAPQTPSLDTFFASLLYTGGDARFPATMTDIWSHLTPTEQFTRFFADGQDLGWGVFVDGVEVQGHPELPLVVRYVDPASPAAAQGIARGDQITAVNGVPAATLIANDDFSAFAATSAGQTLVLDTVNAGGAHHYSLLASVYDLSPVTNVQVLTTPGGRSVGYVMVKDMIDQALTPYDAAFAQFQAAGVQDVILDLRYNAGGLVADGEIMASYPASGTTTNQVYVNLNFSDKQSFQDSYYTFDPFSAALNLSRVYVITGPRTCSAAEQLANGLAPYVEVVTIGNATCGKPFGFTPQDNCGTTYSIVTFEATNVNDVAVPLTGIAPTCPVAEDFSKALGAPDEPLLAAAEYHADNGACPPTSTASVHQAAPAGSLRARFMEPNERQGMK